MEDKKVVFTTDVDEDIADRFDEVAKEACRSRASHLLYLVIQEAKKKENK